ncbi:MAG: DUF5131 family protein [Patescibacteria group bacterium]
MTRIDYVDETVNPLGWGCYGPEGTAADPKRCPYCFAHRFAKRNLVECPECRAFVPHWHPERLPELYPVTGQPKRFFVQDMGDLWHPAVPAEHQQDVLTACALKPSIPIPPRHAHLFLTKCPENMVRQYRRWKREHEDWAMYQNWWFGVTVEDNEAEIARIHFLGGLPQDTCKWLSCEPLRERLDLVPYFMAHMIDWVVIGQLTGPGAYPPTDHRRVESLIGQCRKFGVPVWVKGELAKRFPVQELPPALAAIAEQRRRRS